MCELETVSRHLMLLLLLWQQPVSLFQSSWLPEVAAAAGQRPEQELRPKKKKKKLPPLFLHQQSQRELLLLLVLALWAQQLCSRRHEQVACCGQVGLVGMMRCSLLSLKEWQLAERCRLLTDGTQLLSWLWYLLALVLTLSPFVFEECGILLGLSEICFVFLA